ncbi:MAG TPA: exodeoxyribonuclease VII small subunit [Dehalococcoidia bacterium]|jgi:exodeoxyribonuclease VII small subunit|nr:exodeoxyribonuclease VII small subunit [Chloroflexota bacterium]MDP5878161.1 exodeoxyribonuclease VII small subunit [Dehalococcoidia bacterium]MDP6274019.1 exodeoxyribonuclease VII small subunit [Dehalococcoidia bacterium]MDP7160391.1 exodeoxyribonuclease VII small subunit [Dehalococcoidia bacterium]MDP7213859.1 exodeoxyribonuclease VII small subunit [Dehalococcoidia bacterium]|tara:strand:- start:812 stop:1120 length:309 start_codon:yes stop_codon:yes gene_type:complete
MSPRRAQHDIDGKPDQESANFEDVFSRLEETVRKLETGPLSLDDSTRLFEEGMGLAKRCNELLSATELKVTRLQSAFAEQMRFVPDDPDDGEDPDSDDDHDH